MKLGKLQQCMDILRPYYNNFDEMSIVVKYDTLQINMGMLEVSYSDTSRLMDLGCIPWGDVWQIKV